MECKYSYAKKVGLSAEKLDRTHFATNMHFILSDKNNVNFKRIIKENAR
jgi:hypothetical protein